MATPFTTGPWAAWLGLWADGRFSDLGREFRGEGGLDRSDVAILLCILGVVALVSWVLAKMFYVDETGKYHRPRMLFWQLCRAHRLKLSTCWLLLRLARRQRLTHAAELFLEPRHWDVSKLENSWRKRQPVLQQLQERLFG